MRPPCDLSDRQATERIGRAGVRGSADHGVRLHPGRHPEHRDDRLCERCLGRATGAEATALAVQGNTLAATYDWAFLFGPGLVVGFGNGLMLGYLMYRSGLASSDGDIGTGWRPDVDSFLRPHPLWCVRERVGAGIPAGTAGDRLGGVARHLRRVEGLQAVAHHVRDAGARHRPGAISGGVNIPRSEGVVETGKQPIDRDSS